MPTSGETGRRGAGRGSRHRPQPDTASPLTDIERQTIARQVAVELQIREEVEKQSKKDDRPKSRLKAWLESNLVLLLIGSAITGFLVPYWQQQWETVKWQRQNQHDNYTYRLTQMRQCLQDFLSLTAYPSDANEIAKPVLANAKLSAKQFEQFSAQFLDMQQKRFHESTKVFALFIHFPRPGPLGAAYERYTALVATFMTALGATANESLALASAKADGSKWKALEGRADDLTKHFPGINTSFTEVVAEMRTQIKEVEHESEQLK